MLHPDESTALGDHTLALLRDLLRIDTTNPPGRERPAADLLAGVLADAGVEPTVIESEPGRANVVARLRGTGARPPLLLCAHLDVVPADAGRWSHPPFAAEIHDGFLYGRGAIDMKNMAAMSVAVLAHLARSGRKLDRDIIFAGVADEEVGCDKGSRFLVDHHPELVRAEASLGEVGGFTLHLFGRRFYPIQVAEKGTIWLKATLRGDPGHGSMPNPDSAVVRMARAIARLAAAPLPMHPTSETRAFLDALAAHLPRGLGMLLPRLADPRFGPALLKHAVRDPVQRQQFTALLTNTASPTVVRAGNKTNVIPGEASFEIDGRTLPGQTEDGFLAELRERLGEGVDLSVFRSMPPVSSDAGHPMFQHLADTVRRHDPTGIPVPYIIPGFTDAKAFSRLGTQCYGFSPVQFPPGLVFTKLYHGNDERIPVAGLRWGAGVLHDAVASWCAA